MFKKVDPPDTVRGRQQLRCDFDSIWRNLVLIFIKILVYFNLVCQHSFIFIFRLNIHLLTVMLCAEFLYNCFKKIGNNIMKLYFFELALIIWRFQNSLNYKTRLVAAVNVYHWRFSLIFHPGHYKSFFDYFSGRGPAIPLAFLQRRIL